MMFVVCAEGMEVHRDKDILPALGTSVLSSIIREFFLLVVQADATRRLKFSMSLSNSLTSSSKKPVQ